MLDSKEKTAAGIATGSVISVGVIAVGVFRTNIDMIALGIALLAASNAAYFISAAIGFEGLRRNREDELKGGKRKE